MAKFRLIFVRPMRLHSFVLLAVAMWVITGCAAERYRWSLTHAYLSPSARQLPRQDIEEILRLVSYATMESIVGAGQIGSERSLNEMNVVTQYGDEPVVTVWHLRKEGGKWRIVDHGQGTPFISRSWYAY